MNSRGLDMKGWPLRLKSPLLGPRSWRLKQVVIETFVRLLALLVVKSLMASERFLLPWRRGWLTKKKEVSAEIQLHEVVANIDLLNEIKSEGLVVDEEIVRLKKTKKDCKSMLAWLLFRTGRWRVSTSLKFLKIQLSTMKLQIRLPARRKS
ncbi:hypothetical protein F2Q69_00016340 [Brassica cretica]|uniref:Uncharacterized protein n=1 Tax=Brassica cretica TaxID=69181 RepID=A0A8S9R291_BRACR|nr:hypothetical protein F2Q69_00016340 [Brassica cretica]